MSPALQLRSINAHALPTAALSVATILLVLLSLMDCPFRGYYCSPGWKDPRRLSFTRVLCWASWASSPPLDYG